VTKKIKGTRVTKKNLWQSWSTVEHVYYSPSTILRRIMSVRAMGAKYIPRFFAPSVTVVDHEEDAEIRILVMLRMNHGFMEYMRKTYPNTPLSEFKSTDVYVHTHGLDDNVLVDDEEEEKDEEV
jgi:hypothetical protein